MRAEEADDLAARLAEAKLQLAELGADSGDSPKSQAAVSSASDSEQTRHWLPRAISDAASHAMYPTAKLRVKQVRCTSSMHPDFICAANCRFNEHWSRSAEAYNADFTQNLRVLTCGLLLQAEGLKHSPRMVITPRQAQDNSGEISTLKAEVAALKDEVGTLLTAS